MASLLAIIGILHGCNVVRTFPGQPSPPTLEITQTDIKNYAKTVLKIESQRKVAYQKIEQIIGDSPPEIVCDRPDTLKQLPRNAQNVAVEFCNYSKKVAQESGLTSSQFNQITQKAQKDEILKKQIQNAMIQVRQEK